MISAASGNENTPAIDEQPPTIGPNLATDPVFCGEVVKHITETYWYAYEQAQQKFWDAGRRIDDAWRARVSAADLSLTAITKTTMADAATGKDGKSALGQSVMPFKQIKSITDLMEALSFEGGLPMRAEVPEDVDEDMFYRPTEQSVMALNSIIRQNAEAVDFRDGYRRSAGGFAKYGYGWVHCPLEMRRTTEPRQMPDGSVMPEPRLELVTHFDPLHVFDVFVDPLLKCRPIERQPCPIVREFVTPLDIEANAYDPQSNPFGYLNTELAADATKGHYCLSDVDMVPLRDRLRNRYNLTDTTGGTNNRPKMHQRWTAYPMLRLTEKLKLDKGEGAECPGCDGKRKVMEPAVDPLTGEPVAGPEVDCPMCRGSGKVRPPARRFIVQMYGGIGLNTTCLRIQEMPTGMEIPILFSADLVEDDAASIPMSISEIMLLACEEVTKAESQYCRSKEWTINRGWVCNEDSPAFKIQDKNKPGITIPVEGGKDECVRAEAGNYDETTTLIPYIERKTADIQTLYGATDTLLGMISAGRRSAMEIGEATSAAKSPLVIKTDRHNHQICGPWAKTVQRNMELFGDRDYIRRKTGRTYFGKCRIFTAVGQEFFKRMEIAQRSLEILQASVADPAMQNARVQIWNQLLKAVGINVTVDDGGIRLAQRDGLNIVNKILAEGIPDPALPSDPHEIFVGIFEGALKDPYWQEKYPHHIPLLFERMMQQQGLLQQQQMQQMQMAAAQQQMMNPQGPPNPKKGKEPAKGPGQAMQNAQG